MANVVLGWVSIPEAARLVGVQSKVTIYHMIARGDLVAEKVAGRLCVTAESVEKLVARKAGLVDAATAKAFGKGQ